MIFAAVADAGCAPLCRVPEGNHHFIKRALDAGAWGIVAPMINTVDHARTVLAAAKYPPVGNRSVGGGMHALNFGASSGEYYECANDEILSSSRRKAQPVWKMPRRFTACPAAMPSSSDRTTCVSTCAAPDGREPTDAAVEAMIQRVIAVGKKAGTPTGIHVMDPQDALKRADQGMQFIAVASDLRMLSAHAQVFIQVIYPKQAGKDLCDIDESETVFSIYYAPFFFLLRVAILVHFFEGKRTTTRPARPLSSMNSRSDPDRIIALAKGFRSENQATALSGRAVQFHADRRFLHGLVT